MNRRSLEESLDRWVAAGLIGEDQAEAIAAHEAALAPASAAPFTSRITFGAVLAYAGTLVALAAVFALYVTVFQDYSERARIALTFGIAAAAGLLTLIASRFRRGAPLADALGFATTLIAVWATIELFRAVGWLGDRPAVGAPGYERALGELRGSFLGIALVGLAVGYVAARVLRSPLSALVAAMSLAAGGGVAVWWLASPASAAPGIPGGQAVVIVGAAIALLTLVPGVVGLRNAGRFWWQLGALGAADVAAFALAVETGGAYEGLLLAYAVGLAVVAVLRGGRIFLVLAAVTLYEYVGLVIFRTFQGAVAAIVVLALIGLGTAFTGAFGDRFGLAWLWRWSASPQRRAPEPEPTDDLAEPAEPPPPLMEEPPDELPLVGMVGAGAPGDEAAEDAMDAEAPAPERGPDEVPDEVPDDAPGGAPWIRGDQP